MEIKIADHGETAEGYFFDDEHNPSVREVGLELRKLGYKLIVIKLDFNNSMSRWEFECVIEEAKTNETNGTSLNSPISQYCLAQYDWVERMGWHNKTVLESLALIASEVGEAVNECRGEEPTENFGEELADICLRVFDCAVVNGVNLQQEIFNKMIKNEGRGTRGRKV